MIDFVLRYGEKLAFQVGQYAKPVLYVKSDGNKLSFSEKDGGISTIAGKGMDAIIREPRPDDDRETYKVKYVADGSGLRFSTPESEGTIGVYVDVNGEKFRIVGGASIIREIVGQNLQARLEKDDLPDD